MSDMTIEVQRREAMGKNANRRLRLEGKVPAVVYGAGKESVAIQLERKTLIELMRATDGHNPIFLLKLAGTKQNRHAMIREMQVDPVSRRVQHVDFLRVLMTEEVKVSVHIELIGTPEGVKTDGGVLDFVTREVEVECLPDKIPAHFELNVEDLQLGQHLEVKDLTLPEGVTLHDDADKVVVSISHSRVEAEDDEDEEDLLASDSAEPELISRGKAEEDGAGE